MSGGWGTPSWMKFAEPQIGETFVWGQTQEMARALLDACDAVGVERGTVRTVNGGFIVPNEVWDHVQSDPATEF